MMEKQTLRRKVTRASHTPAHDAAAAAAPFQA